MSWLILFYIWFLCFLIAVVSGFGGRSVARRVLSAGAPSRVHDVRCATWLDRWHVTRVAHCGVFHVAFFATHAEHVSYTFLWHQSRANKDRMRFDRCEDVLTCFNTAHIFCIICLFINFNYNSQFQIIQFHSNSSISVQMVFPLQINMFNWGFFDSIRRSFDDFWFFCFF